MPPILFIYQQFWLLYITLYGKVYTNINNQGNMSVKIEILSGLET